MAITLYKAPNCLRCKITKEYMEANNIPYDSFDLEADKDIVNSFYRNNRARLYRNPEGTEFPMFHDADKDVILQGTGLVLAYLLSGDKLNACVDRSELLHGWISGLNVSKVPAGQESNFLELVRLLAKGGLQVYLVSDGRNSALLEKILAENLVAKMALDIPGPASVYPDAGAIAPTQDDLKKSIALARGHSNSVIRLWLAPLKSSSGYYWLSPDQAGEAASMVADAADPGLPFGIQASGATADGLEPLEDNLLPYRSKVRNYLPKSDILKADS